MTQIVTTPAVVADLQASFDALSDKLQGLLQEVSGAAAADVMSNELISGKLNDALLGIDEARAAIATSSGSLASLSAGIPAEFDSLRTLLADLAAAVAAIQSPDTAALEQLIAANSEAVGVVLDVVNGIADDQDAGLSQMTALASAVSAIAGGVESIASTVSGIATDIGAIKSRLDDLEAGSPDEGPIDPAPLNLLPLAGFNAAGLGNNPQFAPGKENGHFRTFALRDYQADYFAAWAGHLAPGGGDRFLIRVPYALERLFSVADGVPTLQEEYALLIEEVMNQAGERGGLALLDAHNYCRMWQATKKDESGAVAYPAFQRYQGTVSGVSADVQWVPIGHQACDVDYLVLAQMYELIAARFGGNPHLFGYGLMNEPHGRGALDGGYDVQGQWIANVQLLIDAVRSADPDGWITVGGNGYSSAKNWRAVSDGLRNVVGEKIMFEAHQYPDENGGGGGQWKKGILHSIDPQARVNDWTDFLDWCAEVGRPALAGEFGAPLSFEKWTANSGGTFEYNYTVEGAAEYLEQIHAMFDSRRVPRTQWLAGPGDADTYANGMDRADGTLKPNADALFSRLGSTVEEYGPTPF